MGTYDRAVHLLNRFGFGPDADELAAILTMGQSAWLTDRLNRPLEDPGDLAAFAAAFPYFVGRNNYEVPRRATCMGHSSCFSPRQELPHAQQTVIHAQDP